MGIFLTNDTHISVIDNYFSVCLQAPVFLALAHIALVSLEGSCLGCIIEFLCFIGLSFLKRKETYLTIEISLEFIPLRFLRVEGERIFALLG